MAPPEAPESKRHPAAVDGLLGEMRQPRRTLRCC